VAVASANIFYLVFGTAARYGPNSAYFPWGDDAVLDEPDDAIGDDQFAYSLFYASGSVIVSACSSVLGYAIIARCWPLTWQQVKAKYGDILGAPRFYAAIATVLLSNSAIAIWWTLAHARIFFFRIDE
jgi:hypothetical protein